MSIFTYFSLKMAEKNMKGLVKKNLELLTVASEQQTINFPLKLIHVVSLKNYSFPPLPSQFGEIDFFNRGLFFSPNVFYLPFRMLEPYFIIDKLSQGKRGH